MAHHELDSPTTTTSTTNPTNDDLLAALLEFNGDADRVLREFNLSPRRFIAFVKDPQVVEFLALWEAMQERHQRILARQQQACAAIHLSQSILDSNSTAETRRAATALARLAAQMLAPPKPARSPAPPAPPAAPPLHALDPDDDELRTTPLNPSLASLLTTARPPTARPGGPHAPAHPNPASLARAEPLPARG